MLFKWLLCRQTSRMQGAREREGRERERGKREREGREREKSRERGKRERRRLEREREEREVKREEREHHSTYTGPCTGMIDHLPRVTHHQLY